MAGKVAILLAFVPTVCKALYDHYVKGHTEYTSLSRTHLEPVFARVNAAVAPHLYARADIVAAVDATLSAVPCVFACIVDVLYCTSWAKTAKAFVKVHVAAKILHCCSVSGLFLAFLVFMGR